MWPVIGGLISGGANLLGSIFSSNTANENNLANIAAQANQNVVNQGFAADMQKDSQNFSAQMSNTAYQRASADMQLAGLNPMMMFGSGSAASTPSSPAVSAPGVAPQRAQTTPLSGLGSAVSQALTSAVAMKSMDKTTEEIANLGVQNEVLKKQIGAILANTAKTQAETPGSAARSRKEELGIPAAQVGAEEAEGVLGLGPTAMRAKGIFDYGTGAVKNLVDIASPLGRLLNSSSAKGVRSSGSTGLTPTQRKETGVLFDQLWNDATKGLE